MSGRARHGLYALRGGDAPAANDIASVLPSPRGRPSIGFRQQRVVLTIAGTLNADTAGRLRMYLSMFTVDGGPRELVLDLSDVVAVDEDGMAPILEAGELLGLREASLRLTAVSRAVTRYLDDVRGSRTLATGSPPGVLSPDPVVGPAVSVLDDRARRGRD